MNITIGAVGVVDRVVREQDTAAAMASGDLPVLATPALLAWMEEATCEACGSDRDSTTVGVHAELDHVRASAIGAGVTAEATVTQVEGRAVTLTVVARQMEGGQSVIVGRGTVRRMVVNRETFLGRLG